jgi:acyl-CoA thioester hydrolase
MDIYEHPIQVADSAIDFLGHVNNLQYLSWMIDAAIAHSSAVGWPTRRFLDFGSGFVVRSHSIEYLSPAYVDDAVIVRTWIAELKKVRCIRKFRMFRPQDDQLLVRAETVWTYIDFDSRKPTRIPAEVADCFPVVDLD